MKSYILLLSLAVLALFGACEKEDGKDDVKPPMEILVNFPIASVGQQIQFDIANTPDGVTGVRWNMGDGNPTTSGSTLHFYTYPTPGIYTITALVFQHDISTDLSRQVTIE